MKVKKGFELRDVCGEKVIIAQGIENLDFSKLISLNESAALLWETIQDAPAFTAEDLTARLMQEYDVTPEQAAADVQSIIQTWSEQGLIEK